MDWHWCAGHSWVGYPSKHTLSNSDPSAVFFLGSEFFLHHLLLSFTDNQYLSNSLAGAWMGPVQNIHAERQWCCMHAKELSSKLLYRLPEVSSGLFSSYCILFYCFISRLYCFPFSIVVRFCSAIDNLTQRGDLKPRENFVQFSHKAIPSLNSWCLHGIFMWFLRQEYQAVCHCLFTGCFYIFSVYSPHLTQLCREPTNICIDLFE